MGGERGKKLGWALPIPLPLLWGHSPPQQAEGGMRPHKPLVLRLSPYVLKPKPQHGRTLECPVTIVGVQNEPQDVPLWYMDYFEAKAKETSASPKLLRRI